MLEAISSITRLPMPHNKIHMSTCRINNRIKGREYQENFYQMRKFKAPWQERFEMIRNMDYIQIE